MTHTNSRLAGRTAASHSPIKWGALGELKCHTHVDYAEVIEDWSSGLLIKFCSCLLAPMKFMPQSENISEGRPRQICRKQPGKCPLSIQTRFQDELPSLQSI